ncbi:sulfatase [Pelagicoccus mobilis]|uniref:Sulfatase n=1 Tax=Pelagicoccus mobilis TaxID=415221 RepID=A0A934VRU1_9BACT|nr:sulfatase [Pelagicoccus mobilis]MBK1879757.1 sulfatase [Pelagicoccus mobilis]
MKPLQIFAILASILFVPHFTLFAASSGKPNVLFIVVDDLNDYVSLLEDYPGIKTPNLDKFSKTAMTFSQAYCAGPICNPSRTSLISGIAPYRSGIYINSDQLRASPPVVKSVLLPEQFKRNGYQTLWNGKLFHSRPSDKRFAAMWDNTEGGKGHYGPNAKNSPIPDHIERPKNFNYEAWTGPDTDFPDYSNMLINEQRLAQKYDDPFFMVYGIYRPHNPWTAPKRFFDMYPLDEIVMPEVPDDDLDDIPAIGQQYARRPVSLQELKEAGQWKPVVQSYLASISFMDYCLGRVLDALDNGPNAHNTIVCIVADHGFHMGEKQHFAKYALWEKTTRVLYTWRVPGMTEPGSVSNATVNLLDIYPTLNELCGLSEVPQRLDGKSIVPILKDSDADWNRPSITTYQQNDHAIRTDRWRYIRYRDGSEELYDHSNDPNEYTNLAPNPEYASVIANLAKHLPKENAAPVGKFKKQK